MYFFTIPGRIVGLISYSRSDIDFLTQVKEIHLYACFVNLDMKTCT